MPFFCSEPSTEARFHRTKVLAVASEVLQDLIPPPPTVPPSPTQTLILSGPFRFLRCNVTLLFLLSRMFLPGNPQGALLISSQTCPFEVVSDHSVYSHNPLSTPTCLLICFPYCVVCVHLVYCFPPAASPQTVGTARATTVCAASEVEPIT